MISQPITCVKSIITSFFTSPNPKQQKRSLPEEIKDLIDSTPKKKLKTDNDPINLAEYNKEVKEEAKENEEDISPYLLKYKGTLIEKQGSLYKLSCQINHKFSLSLQELKSGCWCKRCENLLQEAKLHAKNHQGEVLNSFYEEFICFLCVNQHIWKIHNKSWKKRWCSKCLVQNREEEKKRHFEENLQKESFLRSYQSKLFEEAKKKSCEFKPYTVYYEVPKHESEKKNSLLNSYKKIDDEAEELARQHFEKNFPTENLGDKETKIKHFICCFKILLIPLEILLKYMGSLSKEELKQEYRECVKMLHPDKNPLPQARAAFLKYHDAYELSLNLLN